MKLPCLFKALPGIKLISLDAESLKETKVKRAWKREQKRVQNLNQNNNQQEVKPEKFESGTFSVLAKEVCFIPNKDEVKKLTIDFENGNCPEGLWESISSLKNLESLTLQNGNLSQKDFGKWSQLLVKKISPENDVFQAFFGSKSNFETSQPTNDFNLAISSIAFENCSFLGGYLPPEYSQSAPEMLLQNKDSLIKIVACLKNFLRSCTVDGVDIFNKLISMNKFNNDARSLNFVYSNKQLLNKLIPNRIKVVITNEREPEPTLPKDKSKMGEFLKAKSAYATKTKKISDWEERLGKSLRLLFEHGSVMTNIWAHEIVNYYNDTKDIKKTLELINVPKGISDFKLTYLSSACEGKLTVIKFVLYTLAEDGVSWEDFSNAFNEFKDDINKGEERHIILFNSSKFFYQKGRKVEANEAMYNAMNLGLKPFMQLMVLRFPKDEQKMKFLELVQTIYNSGQGNPKKLYKCLDGLVKDYKKDSKVKESDLTDWVAAAYAWLAEVNENQ